MFFFQTTDLSKAPNNYKHVCWCTCIEAHHIVLAFFIVTRHVRPATVVLRQKLTKTLAEVTCQRQIESR